MNVEWMHPDDLTPYERNPRQIGKKAIDKVARSLRAFGWQQPIVVDRDRVIVAGHTRWFAARQLGIESVPVHVADLTPEQAQAYRIADNRTAEETSWNVPMLKRELEAIQFGGIEMAMTGFDPEELLRMFPPATKPGDNDAPAAPKVAVTRPGELWHCGNHSLLVGDSTDPAAYAALLGDGQAHMTFTDPPYNVAYKSKAGAIKNDDLGEGFLRFLTDACRNIAARTEGPSYICMSSSEQHTLERAWTAAGGHRDAWIVWAKDRFTLGRSDFQRQYEPILYGTRAGLRPEFLGGDEVDVWHVAKPAVSKDHPTMKPVELVIKALMNSSRAGDVILDPFGGSGTTMIACERADRHARLIELDPVYADVILRRWEGATGRKAMLPTPGGKPKAFEEIAAERGITLETEDEDE